MNDAEMSNSHEDAKASRKRSSFLDFLWNYFEVLTGILGIAALLISYQINPSRTEVLRYDAFGYYIYLPAFFIFKDPGMVDVCRHVTHGKLAEFPHWTGILFQENTGHHLNKYPIGLAILETPFFILAHLTTHLTGGVLDGFSFYYHALVAPAGLFYFLIGIHFLKKILVMRVSRGIGLGVLICIVYGTNLFNYATFEGVFSHVFSFAFITLFVWRILAWHKCPDWKQSVLTGLVLGMIGLIRIPNLATGMIWALYGISGIPSLRQKVSMLLTNWRSVLILFASCFVLLAPQVLYWKFASDRWLINSYQGEYFNFGKPEFLNVLFSVRKGLLFWSPILIFAVFGIFLLRKIWSEIWLSILAYLLFHFYLISSWHMWHYAAGYGHRAFVDDMSLFAILMAACFLHLKSTLVKKGIMAISSLMILLSIFQMVQFWKEAVPLWGVHHWSTYKNIFLRFKTRDEYYREGLALYDAGNYDQAIEKFTVAIEMENNTGYFYARGLARLQKGDLPLALEDFERIISIHKESLIGRLMKGLTLEKLGRKEDARAAYEELIERAGTNVTRESETAQKRLESLQAQEMLNPTNN